MLHIWYVLLSIIKKKVTVTDNRILDMLMCLLLFCAANAAELFRAMYSSASVILQNQDNSCDN